MKTSSAAKILLEPTNSTPTGLRDVRGPVEIANPWVWAAAVLAAAILALLCYWWNQHRKKTTLPESIATPAHRRALDRLKAAESLLSEPKPFCILLSDVMRQYIEEQFKLHAPDRTTEEFLQEVQMTTIFSREQETLLAEFLAICDQVKFAREEPSEAELRHLLQTAEKFISGTAHIPETAQT
ncbi:MAG: DUF4381 family protein [Verrucomicrobiota bacterium]|nr:DUF4381 family protein [Verrucomicrobiota bacterium]